MKSQQCVGSLVVPSWPLAVWRDFAQSPVQGLFKKRKRKRRTGTDVLTLHVNLHTIHSNSSFLGVTIYSSVWQCVSIESIGKLINNCFKSQAVTIKRCVRENDLFLQFQTQRQLSTVLPAPIVYYLSLYLSFLVGKQNASEVSMAYAALKGALR